MPDIAKFLQFLIDGISLGSVFAMIAIGYTMVYGIIGMINFAHGEIYMIGAYIGFVVITGLISFFSGLPLPVILAGALVISITITALYGYSVERFAYRPLRGGQRLVPLISAIGVSIFLQNYVAIGQSPNVLSVPRLIPGAWHISFPNGSSISFDYSRMAIIGVTVIMMIALSLYIKNSRMGRACRACAQDLYMANLLGVDTNKVISFTFMLGAMLASVGGVLISITFGSLTPFIGFMAGLKAFAAAVLGGIGSIPGAMLGGLLLGIVETMAAGYGASQDKDIVAFGILVLILLIRPTGLLGKAQTEKV